MYVCMHTFQDHTGQQISIAVYVYIYIYTTSFLSRNQNRLASDCGEELLQVKQRKYFYHPSHLRAIAISINAPSLLVREKEEEETR